MFPLIKRHCVRSLVHCAPACKWLRALLSRGSVGYGHRYWQARCGHACVHPSSKIQHLSTCLSSHILPPPSLSSCVVAPNRDGFQRWGASACRMAKAPLQSNWWVPAFRLLACVPLMRIRSRVCNRPPCSLCFVSLIMTTWMRVRLRLDSRALELHQG